MYVRAVHRRSRKDKKKMNRKEKKTRNRVLCVISTLNEARQRHPDDADYTVAVDKCLTAANEALEELEEKWSGR